MNNYISDLHPCDPNPCLHKGTCRLAHNVRGYHCDCIRGYRGYQCESEFDLHNEYHFEVLHCFIANVTILKRKCQTLFTGYIRLCLYEKRTRLDPKVHGPKVSGPKSIRTQKYPDTKVSGPKVFGPKSIRTQKYPDPKVSKHVYRIRCTADKKVYGSINFPQTPVNSVLDLM